MSQQIINVGSAPNDGTGDLLRVSQQKANANFTELYNNKQDTLTSTNFGTFSNSLTTEDTIPDAGIFNYTNILGIQVKTTWANIKAKLASIFLTKVSTVDVERVYTINADGSQGTKPLSEIASKRTHLIEFSFAGGNFSNASGYWFYISSYSGKYNQPYAALSALTPSNNFAVFNQAYGYNERVPFDCKVKNVYVHAFNNGATYNLEIAILNYKLASTYASGVSSGVTDRVIIARETNNIVQGLNRTMADSNVDNDYVLTKGSCNRLFINTGGSTNAPIQNPLIIIEVEEV